MPLPTDSRTLADVAATTVDKYLPGVVDTVFQSNALWIRLAERERILVDGGDRLRQAIQYDKLNAGWYSGLDTFDTSRKLTKVPMIFQWKQCWVNISIDGLSMLQNSGAAKMLDMVETEMDGARLTVSDLLGIGVFGDGTGSATPTKALDGLLAAVDDGTNYSTYGGLSRSGGDAIATAVSGIYDATAGAITLPDINTQMGKATIQPEKPDLIATTQTLWNKLWERVQPTQRYPTGPAFDAIARVGFDVININGAAVIVDSHVPAGHAFGLNTSYVKLIMHRDRDFHFTGFKSPINQDAVVGQVLWAGNLVIQRPGSNFHMAGRT